MSSAAATINAFHVMMRRTHQKPVYEGHDVTLAHTYDKGKHTIDNWWWSEKLDGVRALFNGKDLLTRNGKKLNCHPLWTRKLPMNLSLDGELFLDRGKFNHVVSIVRRNAPTHHWLDIHYAVFDSPSLPGTYAERYARLKEMKEAGELPTFLHIMEQHPITQYTNLEDEMAKVLALNGEGIMVRNPTMAYETGRSHNLLKIKGVEDHDAQVIGVIPGEGKHEGKMGALLCRMENGVEFKVGTGFNDTERLMTECPSVGDFVRFKCQEFTQTGKPRFPIFLNVIVK